MTINAKIRPLGATCFLFGASLIASITLAQSAENAAPNPRPRAAKALQTPSALRLESLEVRASKEKYLGGEPVVLTVSLINKSAKTASFLMLGPRLEFAMKREGKIAGLTYKGKDESKGDKAIK